MNIYKFGGASLKDASSIENVAGIIASAHKPVFIVVSAIAGVTNLLEELNTSFFKREKNCKDILEDIRHRHFEIVDELFGGDKKNVNNKICNVFRYLEGIINDKPTGNYDYEYDRIVSTGELISSIIISEYLKYINIKNIWLDARDIILTDSSFRNGKVELGTCYKKAQERIVSNQKSDSIFISQGFIASDITNHTITLGRDGSDYSASIFAYALNARSLTVWKDVPGVFNADPSWITDTTLLKHLTYNEAVELSCYGAKIIHPKTIIPLKEKNIPLYVRSFKDRHNKGTIIGPEKNIINDLPPIFIKKKNQILLSIAPEGIIDTNHIGSVMKIIEDENIKINLFQNAATSFSICIDNISGKTNNIVYELKKQFRISYKKDLELVVIQNYDQKDINFITERKRILVEQKSQNTAQLILANK